MKFIHRFRRNQRREMCSKWTSALTRCSAFRHLGKNNRACLVKRASALTPTGHGALGWELGSGSVGSLFLVGLPASQLPSLPRSPILLGNAIGGIPDPEPIIPDSGVWWAAVRRWWQPRQSTQRPVRVDRSEIKRTDRASETREREEGTSDGRTDGGTCCYGTNP